jgi:hypothetical protein
MLDRLRSFLVLGLCSSSSATRNEEPHKHSDEQQPQATTYRSTKHSNVGACLFIGRIGR